MCAAQRVPEFTESWQATRSLRDLTTFVDEPDRDSEELRQSQNQTNRLAAIGQTVAGLAHESRNALQRAQSGLDLLSLDLGDNPDALEQTARIRRALSDLNYLYEEVRNFAAPLQLDVNECDIADVWRTAWADLAVVRRQRSVVFSENVRGAETNCHIDSNRMRQVFRNILENAISACPESGRIVVECTDLPVDDPAAVCIVIRDNGPGFPSSGIQRVFEPFYTTRKNGTGLGMAIASRIVEAHGGRIEARNAHPHGAELIIILPRDPTGNVPQYSTIPQQETAYCCG